MRTAGESSLPSAQTAALELFCGIGGFAAACQGLPVEVVGAIDQSEAALRVYRHNFPTHPAFAVNLEQVSPDRLAEFEADFWWLSPPCQPYSVKGARRDLADPRAASFRRLLEIFPDTRQPRHLALENVEGFATSRARALFVDLLARHGYTLAEQTLCPTKFGIPMRRPRYYLLASRDAITPPTAGAGSQGSKPLATFIDAGTGTTELFVAATQVERFGPGLRLLDPTDPAAYATCFTAGYGRSLMRAGAFLRDGERVRRFSPTEIARLLGFPPGFDFPAGSPLRKRWQLLGNSLSVTVVRHLLTAFPLDRRQNDTVGNFFAAPPAIPCQTEKVGLGCRPL